MVALRLATEFSTFVDIAARCPHRTDESIINRLRDEIFTTRLGPGERLVELRIAERFGESRATLRSRRLEMTGHVIAARLVKNLRDQGAGHPYRLALMPGRAEQSLEEHAAIAEAVAAGDDAGAQVAMRAHHSSVITELRQWADVER